MRSNQKTAAASRMYTGYNHTVPIAGQRHDVQTEFLAGNPAKIVSHAFLSGRVISSLTQELAHEDLEDELRVRELIKSQQKETIRQLVVSARAQKPGQAQPPSSQSAAAVVQVEERRPAPQGIRRPFADIEVRREMVRVSRAAQRERSVAAPLAVLARLVDEGAAICDAAEGTRSHEVASLLLLRADAKDCLRDGDPKRAAEIVDELLRLARAFVSVNHRAALQAHDHREWRLHLDRLRSLPADAAPSSEELRRLRLTWGRDETVDRLLDAPGSPRNGELRKELARAMEQLEREMRS